MYVVNQLDESLPREMRGTSIFQRGWQKSEIGNPKLEIPTCWLVSKPKHLPPLNL